MKIPGSDLVRKWASAPDKKAPYDAAAIGQNAGWHNAHWYGQYAAASKRRVLSNLLGVYGGSDDSVAWVYAAVSLVQQELASYPYELVRPNGSVIPLSSMPPDLKLLLDEPNQDMTYFDMMEYLAMDLELAGNSYWLKDNPNGLGQPLALERLRPEYIQIAVNDVGRVIGYLYEIPGIGMIIPYDVNDVIHYKRPHPRNEYYGMGTVEAIQRTLETELAQSEHVTGFFSNGARISGVLTTGTMSEGQFERFKQQFYEEYTGDANAHKILIAEEGTRFAPITETPLNSGVVELKRMTKDEILAAFGIHEFLLGGVEQGGVFKMEEAQMIFSRRMMPKARRISEKTTRDLTRLWKLVFKIDVTFAEPRSTKIGRAKGMLEAGGTINEARREMDEPPIAEEYADLPVLPQGFAPIGMMSPGGAPAPIGSGIGPATGGSGGNSTGNGSSNGSQNSGDSVGHAIARGVTTWLGTKSADDLMGNLALLIANSSASAEAKQGPVEEDEDESVIEIADIEELADPQLAKDLLLTREAVFDGCREQVVSEVHLIMDDHVTFARQELKKFSDSKSYVGSRGKKKRSELSPNDVVGANVRDHVEEIVNSVAKLAVDSPLFEMSWSDSPVVTVLREKLVSQVLGIDSDIQKEIAEQVAVGIRRGYTISRILNGFPEENYLGLESIFEKLKSLAGEISRREIVRIANAVVVSGFKLEGHENFEVLDEDCGFSGQIWPVAQIFQNLVGRDNCSRMFVPVP